MEKALSPYVNGTTDKINKVLRYTIKTMFNTDKKITTLQSVKIENQNVYTTLCVPSNKIYKHQNAAKKWKKTLSFHVRHNDHRINFN